MLFLARQRNGEINKDQRLVVVTYEDRVALLCLQADCLMVDTIEKMKRMFGIDNTSTLLNLGCISQNSAIIGEATKLLQIRSDQHPKARGFEGRLIRLKLS